MRWLVDHGLDNHNECILRRVMRRDKPSRAWINGRSVNASMLRDLGRELADIHGQNEHHSLLGKKGQLSLLDNAAGNAELLAQLGGDYEKLKAVRERIEQLKNHGDLARERADLLQFQIGELEALDPRPDEWPQLEQQQKRMHHAQDLAAGARAVAARLSEDGGSEDGGGSGLSVALADCCRQLQRLVEYDARLARVIAMLEEANVNLGESAAQLQEMSAEGALNPAEIAEIEAPLFALPRTVPQTPGAARPARVPARRTARRMRRDQRPRSRTATAGRAVARTQGRLRPLGGRHRQKPRQSGAAA